MATTTIRNAKDAAEMVISWVNAKTFPDKNQSALVGMVTGRYFKKQKKNVDPTAWDAFKSEVYDTLKSIKNNVRRATSPQWYERD